MVTPQPRPHLQLGYPPGHWLASPDPEAVLQAARAQAALTYSQVKNAFLFELLGDLTGARVLDYGCGAGVFAVQAARCGAALVLGVDAQPSALACAALLARREGVADRVRLVVANTPRVAARGRFTAVCLRDVIEHVPDELALLRDLAGCLAPGGRLVLATQNAWSLNFLLEGGVRRQLLGQRHWMGWDPTHLRFHTPRSLRALLAKAGLRPVAWRGAYILPHKIPAPAGSGRRFWRIETLARLDRVLGRFFPLNRLGWSLMVGVRA